MNNVVTLLLADSIIFKRWFEKEKFSKVIVLLGFAGVFGLISVSLYYFSSIFFKNLAIFENYGLITSSYILHAAIILLLYFAVGSSTTATSTFLLSGNLTRDYLLTLPIKMESLTSWLFIRSIFFNVLLLGLLVSPIVFAFANVFLGGLTIDVTLRLIFVIFSLVIISGSLGSLIAYSFLPYILGKEKFVFIMGGVVFFLSVWILMQFIFPSSLTAVYDATPDKFFILFNQLPLVSLPLPSQWFADTISKGFGIHTFYILITTVIISFVSLIIESETLSRLLQNLRGNNTNRTVFGSKLRLIPDFAKTKIPLIIKDLISLIRKPSEVGYMIFLLFLTCFFFLFLWRATGIHGVNPRYTQDILIFSFGWLMFFTTAFLLRLVYPLMSGEGKSFWYIFTIPVQSTKILKSKITTGLILSIPITVISFIIWLFLPYSKGHTLELVVFSLSGIVILTLFQGILGAIKPKFSLGDDKEKVSTSSMGIATLMISIFFIVFLTYGLHGVLSGKTDLYYSLGLSLIIGSIFLFLLLFIFKKSVSHYEYL